jgi:hypothetical protein
MKRLLILLVLLLSGCLASDPVQRHFPEVPDELKAVCPDLSQIDPNTTKLSEVITVVGDNYSQYHECRAKVDSWVEWYNTQRKIFEDVK